MFPLYVRCLHLNLLDGRLVAVVTTVCLTIINQILWISLLLPFDLLIDCED